MRESYSESTSLCSCMQDDSQSLEFPAGQAAAEAGCNGYAQQEEAGSATPDCFAALAEQVIRASLLGVRSSEEERHVHAPALARSSLVIKGGHARAASASTAGELAVLRCSLPSPFDAVAAAGQQHIVAEVGPVGEEQPAAAAAAAEQPSPEPHAAASPAASSWSKRPATRLRRSSSLDSSIDELDSSCSYDGFPYVPGAPAEYAGPRARRRVCFSLPSSPLCGGNGGMGAGGGRAAASGRAAAGGGAAAQATSCDVDVLARMLEAVHSAKCGMQLEGLEAQQQEWLEQTQGLGQRQQWSEGEEGGMPSPALYSRGSLDQMLQSVPSPTDPLDEGLMIEGQLLPSGHQGLQQQQGRQQQQAAGAAAGAGAQLSPCYSGMDVQSAMAAVLASAGLSPTGGCIMRWGCGALGQGSRGRPLPLACLLAC